MTVNGQRLSHIAPRVPNLARAKAFYTEVLGCALVRAAPPLVLVNGDGILLGMRGDQAETPRGDRFNPYRVGLDHLALPARHCGALDGLKNTRDAAGVRQNGSEQDALTNASYSSCYDPDGSAWEFSVVDMTQGDRWGPGCADGWKQS